LRIGRLDRAGQAVGGIIGDAHRIVIVLIGNDNQHGAEDFFLGDAHRIVDVGEQGRLDVVAAAFRERRFAARHQPGSFRLADFDIVQHAVELRLRHHRAHHLVHRFRIAKGRGFEHLLEDGDGLLVARAGNEQPRGNGAALPRVHADGKAAFQRIGELRIVEHDVCGLAAEFEEDPLQGWRGGRHDPFSHAGRAGERDHVHAWIGHDLLARRSLVGRGDHVEDAGRQPPPVCSLAQEGSGQWRVGRALEHDGAAGGKRGGAFGERDLDRHVPRNDRADDAGGLLHHRASALHAEHIADAEITFPFVSFGMVDGPAHHVDRHVELDQVGQQAGATDLRADLRPVGFRKILQGLLPAAQRIKS